VKGARAGKTGEPSQEETLLKEKNDPVSLWANRHIWKRGGWPGGLNHGMTFAERKKH